MNRLHEEYPYYDWNRNKGYPTKKHRAAIAEHGTTPYHRMTFNLLEVNNFLWTFNSRCSFLKLYFLLFCSISTILACLVLELFCLG